MMMQLFVHCRLVTEAQLFCCWEQAEKKDCAGVDQQRGSNSLSGEHSSLVFNRRSCKRSIRFESRTLVDWSHFFETGSMQLNLGADGSTGPQIQ